MNISDAHKESDLIMKIISDNYSQNIDFTIHTDECKPYLCKHCRIMDCNYRKQDFKIDLEWTLGEMTESSGNL